MEEKKKSKFTLFLDKIDDKAEQKGKLWKTAWQFVKFSLVSFLLSLIQLGLVNLLFFLMKSWTTPLPGLLGQIFREESMGEGHSTYGFIVPFFVSNLVANTIGYFLNKSKTFKSDAPFWHYLVYIVVVIILILFTTWLQGIIVNSLIASGVEVIAPTLAGMIAGTIQFFVLFPLQKFVFLREKKKEEPTLE